jgi:hypothetical protein
MALTKSTSWMPDAQRLHVARHAADDAPELHAMEETHRLPLRLRKDLGTQPVHHRLADLERVALAEVETARR